MQANLFEDSALMVRQIVFEWRNINKAFSKLPKFKKKAKTIPPSTRLSRGNVYGKFTLYRSRRVDKVRSHYQDEYEK